MGQMALLSSPENSPKTSVLRRNGSRQRSSSPARLLELSLFWPPINPASVEPKLLSTPGPPTCLPRFRPTSRLETGLRETFSATKKGRRSAPLVTVLLNREKMRVYFSVPRNHASSGSGLESLTWSKFCALLDSVIAPRSPSPSQLASRPTSSSNPPPPSLAYPVCSLTWASSPCSE